MAKRVEHDPAHFIVPLNMNHLQGRMLAMPSRSFHKRDILFVYGHHSSIERWWGLIQELNRYGSVTVPDLPGFGGMDSFYKIGKKPTIDEFADYLAAFIKLRFKRKRLTIIGMSLGFAIVTRMLQRYPDMVDKVDLLVSVVGLAHHDDFVLSKNRQNFYHYISRFFVHRPLHLFLKHVCLNPYILRRVYQYTPNAQVKFEGKSPEDFERMMEMELHLWKINDVRTQLQTTVEMFTLDNCQGHINLPVWHLATASDQYFDNHMVEQHYRVIFREYHMIKLFTTGHGASVIATAEEAQEMIPDKLRRLLAKQ